MKRRAISLRSVAVAFVLIATVSACGGASRGVVPASESPAIASAIAPGTGTLSLTLHLDAPRSTNGVMRRTPQYVSGGTTGIAITGTCSTTGSPAQNCTGAAFPAVYADVSPGSPLCTPAASGQTCTLNANPAPGYTYTIAVAALDAKPLSSVVGYGSGFAATADELSAGSASATIGRGAVNSVAIGLGPIATQFVAIDPTNPALAAGDGVVTATASGTPTNVSLWFATGDAASNLIAAPACIDTYAFSATAATILSPPPAGACDAFAGPDAHAYPLTVTSSVPAHLCAPSNATPPPGGFVCGTSGTAASTTVASDFTGVWEAEGVWTPALSGVLSATLLWDGTAADDACSGTAPKCGVPIPIALTNTVPATAVPIAGRTTSYTTTSASAFFLAPFVTTVSCGTNPSCFAAQTTSGCSGACPQIDLNDGGSATVTVYLYASGGAKNFANSSGCYSGSNACMSITTDGSPPANTAACYTGRDPITGLSSNASPCAAVPDPAAGAGAPLDLAPGTVDCLAQPGAPNAGTVAYLTPGSFTKGTIAPAGTADAMRFTVQAVASGTGTCRFAIQDAFRTPIAYTTPITVNVSSSSTTITVPACQPLLPPTGMIVPNPTSLALSGTSPVATLTVNETNFCATFTAVSENTAIATVVSAGNNAFTVTAGSTPGSTTILVSDGLGNSANVPVTTTQSSTIITIH